MNYRMWKRFTDIILSLIALITLSPLLLIISIVIKLDADGPILFKQLRVGKNKTLFYMYKFRTMRVETPSDIPTHMLVNSEQYITRVGRFLRRTSLDELPQIWNICRGHMSIIGPRPAIWNQFDLIELRDKNGANEIRPGLTGWAQINGRDELTTEEKTEFDGEYVNKIGAVMDIKCFFRTFRLVYQQAGIVEGGEEGSLVMEEAAAAREQIEEDSICRNRHIDYRRTLNG